MGGVVNGVSNAISSVGNAIGGALFGSEAPKNPRDYIQNRGRPEDLKFRSLTDENGNLLPQFKLSSGEDYTKLANQQLVEKLRQSRDDAALQNQGTMTSALSSLASRGGLSEGARRSIARQGAEADMQANQGITKSGIDASNQIGMKQFDIGREAEKANLDTRISNLQAQRNFEADDYARKMAEWGANQTSNSMLANAPKPKGGIVGGLTQGVGSALGKG